MPEGYRIAIVPGSDTGAFEIAPFGKGTFALARAAAELTKSGSLATIAAAHTLAWLLAAKADLGMAPAMAAHSK